MTDAIAEDNSFVKVFLPGVVIGLIVGIALGAMVPAMLDKPGAFVGAGEAGAVQRSTLPRDARPQPAPQPMPESTGGTSVPAAAPPEQPASDVPAALAKPGPEPIHPVAPATH